MNAPTRETATIIAALHYWQADQRMPAPAPYGRSGILMSIATDNEHFENLSAVEVQELIEHISMSADASRQIIAQIRTVIADPSEDETTGQAKVEALLTQLEALL